MGHQRALCMSGWVYPDSNTEWVWPDSNTEWVCSLLGVARFS